MGGRGSSSGGRYRKDGTYLPYGSEYTTLLKSGNIKFVRYNGGTAAKAPMETMTRGRVYVTVAQDDTLKYISYHDNQNNRNKQIDLDRPHHGVSPHVHHGREHNENDGLKGFSNLTPEEKKMVDRAYKIWYNRHSKQ